MDNTRNEVSQRFVEKMNELSLQVLHGGSLISERYVLKASYMITVEQYAEAEKQLTYTGVTPGETACDTVLTIPKTLRNSRPLHQHDFLELMMVLEGKVIQHIEEKTYEYGAGACCILNTHTRHCEEFSTDFKAVFLMISDDFLRFIKRGDLMLAHGGKIRQRKSPILSFMMEMLEKDGNVSKEYLDLIPVSENREETLARVSLLFETMTAENRTVNPGSYLLTAGCLARLFSILEDESCYVRKRTAIDNSRERILFAQVAQLLEESGGHVSRSKLEKETNYNADYLNWIVKKHTGKSLTEYGQTFSLERAERLLVETDLSVTEIIRRLGFSNRSYFYRIFKEKFSVTPKEYRDIYREK